MSNEGIEVEGLQGHEPIRRSLDRASLSFPAATLKRTSARGKFMLGMGGINISTARKDYLCQCCGEPIKKGDKYAWYGKRGKPDRIGVEDGWIMRLECL